jgi:hypothetical protein
MRALVASALVLCAAPGLAQTPRGYLCYRASAPLAIDGRLDDAAWKDAPWTEDFVDIEGDKKPRPPLRTRAKLLWDDDYLYVAAEMVEPRLWATLKEHDSVIFRDHDFEVFVDPNGDNHEYYEFEINALGTTWDLMLPRPYKDGGRAIDAWEIPGLKSAVHLDGTLNDPRDTDRGWSLELAFPIRVLTEQTRRYTPPADGEQWRVNFSRVEWQLRVVDGRYEKVPDTKEDNWVWSPQGVINMHRPETWGYVQFSTAKPGSATFRPDPALAARRWLHQVYYAQREFRRANKRYATTFEQLGVPAPTGARLETTSDLFQVSLEINLPDGKTRRWNIRQDSLIWAN